MHGSSVDDMQRGGADAAGLQLLDLDDASLCAILSWLNAKELATVSLVCSTFHAAAKSNLLWLQLIEAEFNVAFTTQSHAQPAAALALYHRLLKDSSRPRALPCRGVATDGGCDDPNSSTYWADNLFRYTVADLYCSDAATSNVHVLGRLVPHPSTPGARKEDIIPELQQSTEAIRDFIYERCMSTAKELIAQDVVAAAAEPEAAAAAAAAAQTGPDPADAGGPSGSQQQQHNSAAAADTSAPGSGTGGGTASSSGSSGKGLLYGLSALGHIGRSVWSAATAHQRLQEQRQLAAAAALASCSTRGLCEFFAESYNASQNGDQWAEKFFKGLKTDNDIHKTHMIMFALWSEQVHVSNRSINLHRWPLSSTAAAAAVQEHPAAAAAAPAAHHQPAALLPAAAQQQAVGGQQQQQQPQPQQVARREMLCDLDQLMLLKQASLADSSCLVQEVFVSRGAHATCPVTTGLIYLGCQLQQQQQGQHTHQHQQQQRQHQHQQGDTSAAAGLGVDASAPPPAAAAALAAQHLAAAAAAAGAHAAAPTTAAAAAQVQAAAEAAVAAEAVGAALSGQLGRLLQQSWVAASNNLSCAAAVFAAVDAGQLPAVLDYAAAGPAAEWIEFELPAQEQLQQQWHGTLADGGSSSGGGCGSSIEGSSEMAGVVMIPVLWFSFKPGFAAVMISPDADGEQLNDLIEEDEDEGQPGVDGDADADDAGSDGAAAGQEGADAAEAAEDTAAAPAAASSGAAPLAGAVDQQAVAAAAAVADGSGMADLTSIAGSSSDSGSSPMCGLGGNGRAAGAGPVVPTPRAATPWAQCDPHPQLPASAPEVAAALGWYPGLQQELNLAVRLQRPRLAQLLCVKLIGSEDCSPQFNAQRGGCNIDCEMVMCRGQDLQGLPEGVRLLGPGCNTRR